MYRSAQAAAATGEAVLAPTTAILTAGASLSGKGLAACEASRQIAAARASEAERGALDNWSNYKARRREAAILGAERKAAQGVMPEGTTFVETAGQPA